jgi:hypothetical protein
MILTFFCFISLHLHLRMTFLANNLGLFCIYNIYFSVLIFQTETFLWSNCGDLMIIEVNEPLILYP